MVHCCSSVEGVGIGDVSSEHGCVGEDEGGCHGACCYSVGVLLLLCVHGDLPAAAIGGAAAGEGGAAAAEGEGDDGGEFHGEVLSVEC
mmetsp:Transcript_21813/g.32642  ORF Transcript_21813/g.32642 Transcript_21813/m.32642 type:complete len:88 (-) Transcript_21813:84-347(-)